MPWVTVKGGQGKPSHSGSFRRMGPGAAVSTRRELEDSGVKYHFSLSGGVFIAAAHPFK